MQLKVKLMKWSAGIPVAMLNLKTAKEIGVHAGDRISLKKLESRDGEFSTIVDLVARIVKEKEIGISREIKSRLKLREGQKVDVNLAKSPRSLSFVRKKFEGKKLKRSEIKEIIADVVNNSLSESEIALFVSAMYKHGMNFNETIFLIDSILETGHKLNLKNKLIVDKHSIGGIPGNRTTPIVVSICAAAGLIFPKTSSKAITSAAGTADVIEAIADIEFSSTKLKKIIKKTNACMVWGGALGLVPADSKIIKVEKMLKIDPRAQLLASIMSKKLAVGSKFILIDIPYGKTAKVSKSEGLILKKEFEKIAKHFKLKLKVVLTKGNEPIGNGVGPMLELIDLTKVLNPSESGPCDLEEKSLFLAGQILEMTGKAGKNKGVEKAKEILCSGKAFEKFLEIIKAQNGDLSKIKLAKHKKDVKVDSSVKIVEIDNKKINFLARIAGCPVDKSSGIYLHAHVGSKLKKSEKLITIYAESKPRLKEALRYYKKEKPLSFK